MRVRPSVLLSLLLSTNSCSKRAEQKPPPPAATTSATTAASAKQTEPPLPPTKRVFPKTVTASSEITRLAEPHLAWSAFDGSIESAWSEAAKGPGKGEWLEATFAVPRHVRSIRITTGYDAASEAMGDLFFAHAHARSLRITTGDGKELAQRGAAEGERSVTFKNLDADVTTLRVTFDEVWPGRKVEDLSISEIEIIADDDGRVSSVEAPPSLEETLPELAKLQGNTTKPYELLLGLGFPEPVVHEQQWSKVRAARVSYANLDVDPEPEGVIALALAPPQDEPPRPYVRFFYAFVDDAKHARAIVGRRDFYALACGDSFHPPGLVDTVGAAAVEPVPIDPTPTEIARLRFDRVHDARFEDAIIEWTTPLLCDDLDMGRRFAMVLTLERGIVEELVHFEDTFRANGEGKLVDPVRLFTIGGDVPRKVDLHELGKPKRTLAFDAEAFHYR